MVALLCTFWKLPFRLDREPVTIGVRRALVLLMVAAVTAPAASARGVREGRCAATATKSGFTRDTARIRVT